MQPDANIQSNILQWRPVVPAERHSGKPEAPSTSKMVFPARLGIDHNTIQSQSHSESQASASVTKPSSSHASTKESFSPWDSRAYHHLAPEVYRRLTPAQQYRLRLFYRQYPEPPPARGDAETRRTYCRKQRVLRNKHKIPLKKPMAPPKYGPYLEQPLLHKSLQENKVPIQEDNLEQIDVMLALRRRYNMLHMEIHRRRKSGGDVDQTDTHELEMIRTLKASPSIVMPTDLSHVSPNTQSQWKYAHDLTRAYQEKDQRLRENGKTPKKWNPKNLPTQLRKFNAWRQSMNSQRYNVVKEDAQGFIRQRHQIDQFKNVLVVHSHTVNKLKERRM